MYEKIIIDADICIKLGCSSKYKFLYEIVPLLTEKAYIHTHTFKEIKTPVSAKEQLRNLIKCGVVEIVDEKNLDKTEKDIYNMAYRVLSEVMISPNNPNKNKGETCSLAYAKAKAIPIFATDESKLQPIIDKLLNIGIDDIKCLRIINIIEMIRDGYIDLPRKYAKALWRISSGMSNANEIFDNQIWEINS